MIPVITSKFVPPPRDPTPGEWARRYVRHGLADVLEWLGEPVGPEPDAKVHVMFVFGADVIVGHELLVAHFRANPQAFAKIEGAS